MTSRGEERVTIVDELRRFLREAFQAPDDLRSDTSLVEAGIVDSRGVVEVIAFVEERYGFTVGDLDVHPDNFDSLDRVAAYVQRMTDERRA
jgi:acyl carrier protein